MNRNLIIFIGVICWTGAFLDAGIHLINGNLWVPTGMAAIFVVWVGLRQVQTRLRRVGVRADRSPTS